MPYSVMPEQVNSNKISTTINGLTSGVVYSFLYRAQNVFGWSGYSQQVSVKTETEPHAPNIPLTIVVGD